MEEKHESHESLQVEGFDELVYKFTELLTGEATEENIEKVKVWSMYSHMLKVMPPLIKHWNSDNPDAKAKVRGIFEDVQRLNQENKQKTRQQQSKYLNKDHE